jgi:hypothetical protein
MKAESATAGHSPQQIAAALESFLAEHGNAVVLEDGKVLFDLREAKYTLSTEHNRCTLHMWSEERNLVRRIVSTDLRAKVLRLATQRFGQTRPQMLEIAADRDRRTPSTREATRTRFLKVLERALLRHFPDWHAESFRTAMDLEKSFGPAYARGLLVRGQTAWAVIAVNDEESLASIDGILTFGILWLEACREAARQRTIAGLKIIVPDGTGNLTLSRLAWLAGEGWSLLELDQHEEHLTERDPADHGNLSTHLVHAPNQTLARDRFAASSARVMALVPAAFQSVVEQHLRSATYLAFLLHGLEFARIRIGAAANSFNRLEEITFGAGAAETTLAAETEDDLRELVARLCERRSPAGDQRDPLFRMQPERWLEGELRRNLTLLDTKLSPEHIHAQVAAFAAHDRGMMDLLSVHDDGRLAVIEIKAAEDPQLALQGLDYWIRVRWHHQQHPDAATGLGEFQRHGYFGGLHLSPEPPRLYLAAPSLRIHPATEVVLRHFSPRVDWTLAALDERWRSKIKVVWRKRSTDR